MWSSQSLLPSADGGTLFATSGPDFGSLNPSSSYLRAAAIAQHHDLDIQDILTSSPKFWPLHKDPILSIDPAAAILLTIQYNLCLGTLSRYVPSRSDLRPMAESLLKYETIGQFCLTEIGHGLDAFNLGTIATSLPDGSFELHSPTSQNAKYMPPTTPVLGRPCVAVVFARLLAHGEDKGIRPFLVQINDGRRMCPGITASLLPYRHGSAPVNHSVTYFHHVKLPKGALLGDTECVTNPHMDFLLAIWRVGVGTLALSSCMIPAIRIATSIAYRYSFRRHIGGRKGETVPIISFRTQQLPVFFAIAQAYILDTFHKHAVRYFMDNTMDPRVRHGIATTFKAGIMSHTYNTLYSLSERCGAQGLFGYNKIVSLMSEVRGASIAEGDTLVLCIRLANELFLDRYAMPSPADSDSLLARHETSLLAEGRALAKQYGHRSPEFASLALTRCVPCVEAIAHRMAYEAAIAEGVARPLIDLYASQVIKGDFGWYAETGAMSRAQLAKMECDALDAIVPHASQLVEDMHVDSFVEVPILSDASWERFVRSLPTFSYGTRIAVTTQTYPSEGADSATIYSASGARVPAMCKL
ncbi:hypothetical protein PUNSTDRAFT_131278 [Punctularia strigosozonata HHB-11173 SS5]|uniref:uncharacterized protein n=1 Tax=Punctularia strigosozonata (strain HHB-11173) TaxID=741275 RepID=UPI0004416F90|nr:uncharacterized protein PUNSTDRAFT_131278 [Punctularia strigosozonata HHB-11173 SS5]EIN13055.1 hypothetical protein PUNSTDRAFT_131278 [Punctularia strigosozonata HHB-11173 SS5]